MGFSSIFGGGKESKSSKRAANLQAQIAKDQWDMYKEIYAPVERAIVSDSQKFDTPEQYERLAGEAAATVSEQFGKARERLNRTPGLDPSSPAYHAAIANLELGQGLADVSAQNGARQYVKDMAFKRKLAVTGIGRGIPGLSMEGLGDASRNFLNISNSQFSKGIGGLNAVTDLVKSGGKAAGQIFGMSQ